MDKSQQAVSVFDRRAADYQARFMDISPYHESLEVFCRFLPPSAQILEVACGPGNVTRHLLDRRPDLRITGTDLAPNMIALARKNNPEAVFRIADMRAIERESGPFDAVVCGFGFPYLTKAETMAFITALPNCLEPNGMFYFSTMEGAYSGSGMQRSSDGRDEVFIHLHETGYLTEALALAGFHIEWQRLQPYPKDPTVTDLIVIARWNRK